MAKLHFQRPVLQLFYQYNDLLYLVYSIFSTSILEYKEIITIFLKIYKKKTLPQTLLITENYCSAYCSVESVIQCLFSGFFDKKKHCLF